MSTGNQLIQCRVDARRLDAIVDLETVRIGNQRDVIRSYIARHLKSAAFQFGLMARGISTAIYSSFFSVTFLGVTFNASRRSTKVGCE